jgi:hypothetical protein
LKAIVHERILSKISFHDADVLSYAFALKAKKLLGLLILIPKLFYNGLVHHKNGEFMRVASIALLAVSVLLLRTNIMTYDHPHFAFIMDHHKYIRMAAGSPFDFYIAPFCWRVVNPLIARLLPFDLQWNFLIISFISVWMTGVAIYYLAKKLNFSKELSLIGMFMFFH